MILPSCSSPSKIGEILSMFPISAIDALQNTRKLAKLLGKLIPFYILYVLSQNKNKKKKKNRKGKTAHRRSTQLNGFSRCGMQESHSARFHIHWMISINLQTVDVTFILSISLNFGQTVAFVFSHKEDTWRCKN